MRQPRDRRDRLDMRKTIKNKHEYHSMTQLKYQNKQVNIFKIDLRFQSHRYQISVGTYGRHENSGLQCQHWILGICNISNGKTTHCLMDRTFHRYQLKKTQLCFDSQRMLFIN